MKTKMLGAVLASFLLAGCSDPKNYKLPEKIHAITDDVTLKKKVETLSEEEKKLFASYAMRALMAEALGKSVGDATTIGEAIAIQHTWQNTQAEKKVADEKKKQEVEEARSSIIQEMHATVTPTVETFGYKKEQYDDFLTIGISFKNISSSDISGLKGAIVISDMFGVKLKKSTISTDHNIKAGETISGAWDLEYNQFRDGDKTLKTADVSKLQFSWNPETYIFADGTKLTLEY